MPSSHRSPADLHALLHEKLDALLADCDQVMDTAQHGQTLHDLDDFFCTQRRGQGGVEGDESGCLGKTSTRQEGAAFAVAHTKIAGTYGGCCVCGKKKTADGRLQTAAESAATPSVSFCCRLPSAICRLSWCCYQRALREWSGSYRRCCRVV